MKNRLAERISDVPNVTAFRTVPQTSNLFHFYNACVFFALTVLTTSASAAISVNGTTLSWPDDGWYQVQRSDNFLTICEGGTQCDVAPGSYIVINHSTGERFDKILVKGDTDNSQELQIEGNLISWSDDGWYQVQNASDFTTVCEGGRQCSVVAGSYTVINHTTGQRYADIQIAGDASNATRDTSSNDIRFDDNYINLPDDGWYEVQYADTYQSACQGSSSSCAVGYGEFIVINHTTGVRTTVNNPEPDRSIEISQQSINPDNAVLIAKRAFEIYSGKAFNQRFLDTWSLETRQQLTANLVTEQSTDVGGVDRVYSCDNGGTASERQYQVDLNTQAYDVTFDNCQVDADLITGRVIREVTDSDWNALDLNFDNYTVKFEREGILTAGGRYAQVTNAHTTDRAAQNRVTMEGLSYSFRTPEDNQWVGNANSKYQFELNDACCTTEDSVITRTIEKGSSFFTSAPNTRSTISGIVTQTFSTAELNEDRYFSEGRLSINSEQDSSSMVLDVENSDPESVNISVSSKFGRLIPVASPWPTWQDSFRFE